MAREEKLQKIGVVKVGKDIVPVLYVGGSMFRLDFPNQPSDQAPHYDKSVIDRLIEKKQLQLTSQDAYERICASIDPVTGDTKDYHADGSKKTEVEKTLQTLNQERSVKRDRTERAKQEPEHGRAVPQIDESLGNEVAGVAGDPTAAHSMTRSRPSGPQVSQEDLFGDSGGTGQDASLSFSSQAPTTASRPHGPQADPTRETYEEFRERQHRENPSLKTSPAKRRTAVAALAGVAVIGCVACFAVTASLTDSVDPSGIPVIGKMISGGKGKSAAQPEEKPGVAEEGKDGSQEGTEVVLRTDFDPEDAVVHFPLASSDKQDLAVNFFKAIRVGYSQGNLDQLNSMIAYDYVHGQIADAYATAEQQRLQLSDEARAVLRDQYVAIMNQQEGTHLANHDLDASIYCGRIREVRADDTDPNRLYVVMESLGGDHQRACFILQGDPSTNMYALVGMTDPEGYVRMIREGPVA